MTDHSIDCCMYDLSNRGIFPPSKEALVEILQKDSKFLKDIAGYTGVGTLDTFDRDGLFDIIAKHFVGRSWPCFGDGVEEARRFKADLQTALLIAGWLETETC